MPSGYRSVPGLSPTQRHFPDAVRRETVRRRSGIVPNSALVEVPVLQRITFVLRCAQDTSLWT
jgi:hypothetical protein